MSPTTVAFVTGANRGLGRAFATELVARGAKVYAGARRPELVDVPGVIPVALDITDPASVAAAAAAAPDVTLLVNNAGVATGADLLEGDLDAVRLDMETNYFGTLQVSRAFAPVLGANGGGSVLTVLSVLSWVSAPQVGGYAAAKSAEWSLTNALRLQLAGQGTSVTGLHVGYIDTDMTAGIDEPKADPADVARVALDAAAARLPEVLYDDVTRGVQAGLAGGATALYPALV